ncbi:MAG: DUF1653 domain-containing protein [Gammaproteobacteria bacterium]|nr:DUF1653 domain-containing protein [Gammaproteobacteria bacterium]
MNELKLGKYRHYKGNDYEVIGVAQHSETFELLVVYKPLYNDSGYWVRPLSMFTEHIELNGQTLQRFTYIDAAK